MSGKAKQAICALCEKPVAAAYRPFCSKRCGDIDLHRWLKGAYVIPGDEDEGSAPGPSDFADGQRRH